MLGTAASAAAATHTCIRHRQDACSCVLKLEVLIRELGTIYGLATSTIASSEVTTCQ